VTLDKIKELINAEILNSDIGQDIDVKFAKASDLMSDVLAFSEPGALLLTGLTNTQVIRTCEIAGVCAIVFVRGKNPLEETIKLAKDSKIPILATKLSMFDACGILYRHGLRGSI
jgi:predicted transcriptional regulator